MAEWTKQRLRRRCRYWQQKYRLTDWNVTIRFCSADELEENEQARNTWNEHSRTSEIRIIHPSEYTSSINEPQDIEDTIRHELVHLLFVWLGELKGSNLMLLEQAIESIAGSHRPLKRKRT